MNDKHSDEPRRAHFHRQAEWSDKLGSPFTARLCRVLGDRLDATSRFGRRVLAWPLETLKGDLVALRCCGALHYWARTNKGAGLAKVYPPHPLPEVDRLWEAVSGAIAEHDEALTGFLDSAPQTNEVARASVLLGGCLRLTERWQLPLSLIEIGASAGLNLNFDHFAYDLGEGRNWGDPRSGVRVKSEWRGPVPPLDAPLKVAARIGNDLNPLSPARDDDRRRLIAYVWPDQFERLKRLEAALDIAARIPVEMVKEDAAAFLARRLAEDQESGRVRLVFHTIVLQYASPETRAAIKATLAAAGAQASDRRPLARLSMEHEQPDQPATVRLTLWPGGEERIIARCDSHGGWVEWLND